MDVPLQLGDTGSSADVCKIHMCDLNKGGNGDPGVQSIIGCTCMRTGGI
jgi:hypothetical protein